ncbi:skin secretory protein xP2-like [Lolium rigidum]|uniref:skin secretory protein xP2-like n=1 Tax=Lolium rigidum TaxID=89674 RepID=UPI001F5DB4B7|nr:skin secretory protein xP2-like [Lolium rigidum]
MHCAPLASALLLCSLFLQPPQAFGGPGAYISRLLGEGYSEEKLPMTIVVPSVPDNSPRPAPSSAAVAAPAPAPTPTPAPAPATVPGSEDYMPTLPSEGRGPGAPSSGSAGAPAPADGASTAFISSNPAVPLPAGVTDSATVLPMPTPGQEQRQDVGAGTLLQARTAPLVLPLLMVVSFLAFLFG